MPAGPRASRTAAPAPQPPATTFVAGFESTYLPLQDVDITETTGHDAQWRADLDRLPGTVRQVRYPIRWHRVEPEPGRYDWAATDRVLGHLHDRGVEPIVDLVHHTSYPAWLSDGLRDRRFGDAYVRFAAAVAGRYPWLTAYTLFNEPFSTLYFAGHEALWPPYDSGLDGFARLATNVLPALSRAAACWRELLPAASHVWVDTCEHHAGVPGVAEETIAFANDRRHVVLDLAIGHDLDPGRPFLAALLRAGGEALLDMPRLQVDVLGLDYYAGHEWWYDERGGRSPSPEPVGFAFLAELYGRRYGLDLMLGETNLRGLPSDRATWLKYTLEQYERAVGRGVPLRGYCWYPHVDSADWDSLLARGAGRTDPVGVVSIEGDARVDTVFTDVWTAAAAGARAADLPAYRLHTPAAEHLAGFTRQLSHWEWVDPPSGPTATRTPLDQEKETDVPVSLTRAAVPAAPAAAADQDEVMPDLVVLSHLRWTFVWQRPQHLVSRFARRRAAQGARTFFVEEPLFGDVAGPEVRSEQHGDVTRVWLMLPGGAAERAERFDGGTGYDDPRATSYAGLLIAFLAERDVEAAPEVLLYTPMAIELAEALEPVRLAYDVMDDLAAFRAAPAGMVLRQRRLLAEADVVFAGGRSLHRSASAQRRGPVHLFPSGVDVTHYDAAVALREPRERLVAGYVGVIDERLDLDLLAGLAAALPDWDLQVVGPVAKIDPDTLPVAPNLHYPGMVAYSELPQVMAGFDVALMPFALNEATRSISPTKTLEYLAAGLPVVSTRVPDVVADYTGTVHLADDAAAFAAGCRKVVADSRAEREQRIRHIKHRQEWDTIAAAIDDLIHPGPPSSSTRRASA